MLTPLLLLLVLSVFLGVDCTRVRFHSGQGLGFVDGDFEASHTIGYAAAKTVLPAFGINVEESEVSKYVDFVMNDKSVIPMDRNVARLKHVSETKDLFFIQASIKFYLKPTVLPKVIYAYEYDMILSTAEDKKHSFRREQSSFGSNTLNELSWGHAYTMIDGIIRMIAPDTPLHLLPRNGSNKSIAEIFINKPGEICLLDMTADDTKKGVVAPVTKQVMPDTTLKTVAKELETKIMASSFLSRAPHRRSKDFPTG